MDGVVIYVEILDGVVIHFVLIGGGRLGGPIRGDGQRRFRPAVEVIEDLLDEPGLGVHVRRLPEAILLHLGEAGDHRGMPGGYRVPWTGVYVPGR